MPAEKKPANKCQQKAYLVFISGSQSVCPSELYTKIYIDTKIKIKCNPAPAAVPINFWKTSQLMSVIFVCGGRVVGRSLVGRQTAGVVVGFSHKTSALRGPRHSPTISGVEPKEISASWQHAGLSLSTKKIKTKNIINNCVTLNIVPNCEHCGRDWKIDGYFQALSIFCCYETQDGTTS